MGLLHGGTDDRGQGYGHSTSPGQQQGIVSASSENQGVGQSKVGPVGPASHLPRDGVGVKMRPEKPLRSVAQDLL
jgi:hypothetical protein